MNAAEQAKDLDAQSILAIPENQPERLFPPEAGAAKQLYRRLARRWHPDVSGSPDALPVFKRIDKLYNAAVEKLQTGTWQEVGYFTCNLVDGKRLRVRSDAERRFDLGVLHISPTTATYVVERQYEGFFRGALQTIGSISLSDSRIRDVYFPRLPTTFKTYEAQDSLILTLRKSPDEVLLRDLAPYLAKDNRDRHVAWITSRMLELARLLNYLGLSHNAITSDSLFVSPEQHTLSLFGGWWYATPLGQPLEYVAQEAVEFLPDADGKPLSATSRLDVDMAKAVSRELLGDRGGTSFSISKPAPAAMLNFLRQPGHGDPQKEIESWYQKALPDSFGPRTFVRLPVTYAEVYSPAG